MLSARISELAVANGIDIVGFTGASAFEAYKLQDSRRKDPKITLPDARTIVVAGIYIGGITLPQWSDPMYGRTSRLYLSGFFIDVIKPLWPIKKLLEDAGYKAVICNSAEDDTSILPLKLAAVRAGFGWQGKNSLLITRKYGSFLALGGIITNALINGNEETEPNRCNKCTKCVEACPTKALEEPYRLNRNKCLALLLQKEQFPDNALKYLHNSVGDCEICQNACPWNKKHKEFPLQNHHTKSFDAVREKWAKVFYLPDLVTMTNKRYKDELDCLKTQVPFDVFQRNARWALKSAEKGFLS